MAGSSRSGASFTLSPRTRRSARIRVWDPRCGSQTFSGKLVWDPHDSSSVPRGDRGANERRYKDVREVLRAGDALCHAAALTLNPGQTQAAMRGGEDVDEYEVVGLADVEDM